MHFLFDKWLKIYNYDNGYQFQLCFVNLVLLNRGIPMKDCLKNILLAIINIIALCLFFTGCIMESNTCVSCHSNKKLLKEVAAPIKANLSSPDG